MLGMLALLARVGVLGALAGLGATALWPDSVPSSLPSLVKAAAERNHLDPAMTSMFLAVLVACAAVPILAGLDFARSLADNRAVTRALRAALQILQQYDQTINPAAIPAELPAAVYRAPTRSLSENRRRIGDLLNG
jgi:hypothetical protein